MVIDSAKDYVLTWKGKCMLNPTKDILSKRHSLTCQLSSLFSLMTKKDIMDSQCMAYQKVFGLTFQLSFPFSLDDYGGDF